MNQAGASRRPPYPLLPSASSPTTSAFQNSDASSSSQASSRSASSMTFSYGASTSQQQQPSCPLPSPTTSQQSQFFGSIHPQMNQQRDHRQQQALQQSQQQQGQQGSNYQYNPDRNGSGATEQETNTHLNQYSLIAEAAKRAQMAVLTRDLNGVDLG